MSHSSRPATGKQRKLLSELANERGYTYATEDLHCTFCASDRIEDLIKTKRDNTDYRPSRNRIS